MPNPIQHILLIGNLNAGKTTLANALAQKLNWPTLSIDKMRETVATNWKYTHQSPLAAEYLAWHKTLEILENTQPIIFEFSGTGIHRHSVKLALQNKLPYLVVELTAPKKILLKRSYKQTKLPTLFILNESTQQYIQRVENQLQQLRKEQFWKPAHHLLLPTHNQPLTSLVNTVKKYLVNPKNIIL